MGKDKVENCVTNTVFSLLKVSLYTWTTPQNIKDTIVRIDYLMVNIRYKNNIKSPNIYSEADAGSIKPPPSISKIKIELKNSKLV